MAFYLLFTDGRQQDNMVYHAERESGTNAIPQPKDWLWQWLVKSCRGALWVCHHQLLIPALVPCKPRHGPELKGRPRLQVQAPWDYSLCLQLCLTFPISLLSLEQKLCRRQFWTQACVSAWYCAYHYFIRWYILCIQTFVIRTVKAAATIYFLSSYHMRKTCTWAFQDRTTNLGGSSQHPHVTGKKMTVNE